MQGRRQALPTIVFREGQGTPARFGIEIVGLLETTGSGDRMILVPGTSFLVSDNIEWMQDFSCNNNYNDCQ